MKDAYTKLMVQQHTSADADAAFFEKLENTARKKQKPAWKAAVASACVLLLGPITALAAKYILHQPQVAPVEKEFKQEKVAHYGTFKGMETIKEKGYEIEYPDLAFFSIEDIPEEYQKPEATTIAYNSWKDAADALNIGVLKNSFLSNELITMEYCMVESRCIDNQPFVITQIAQYKYDNLVFIVTATIGIENPNVSEEEYAKLRKSGSSMAYKNKPSIYIEDYTTAGGIPVVISSISTPLWYRNNFALYDADFAVNNIKYNINFPLQTRYNFNERNYKEDTEALIAQILEGFVLE